MLLMAFLVVICPCCVGKITLSRSRPLSSLYNDILTDEQYQHLVRAADFGHGTDDRVFSIHDESLKDCQRRICKCYVEEDRRLFAEEHSYISYITDMRPRGATPKSDIIVGWPASSSHTAVSLRRCKSEALDTSTGGTGVNEEHAGPGIQGTFAKFNDAFRLASTTNFKEIVLVNRDESPEAQLLKDSDCTESVPPQSNSY
jgi:hypothetical protein